MTGRERIIKLLNGESPDRIIYSPNIWQWFYHHKNHNTLPEQLKHCTDLLEAHLALGEDCFSRNLASDQREQWYGGFTDFKYDPTINLTLERNGPYKKMLYNTPAGTLEEEFLYEQKSSTLIQTKYILDGDLKNQLISFKHLISSTHFEFDAKRWNLYEARLGDAGMNICGCWCNPLKLFHFAANPANTTFILHDYPSVAQEIMEIHTDRCIESIKQAIAGGVKCIMTMDNLDSNFFPPPYFEKYCAPFFKKISQLCHQYNVKVFSHACGQIKELLPYCMKSGLDGLEGVTPPPLGDIELYDALSSTEYKFICIGGISAHVQQQVKSKQECFEFTRNLFSELISKKAFVLGMSCNTTIDTSFDVIRWFGEATKEYSGLIS